MVRQDENLIQFYRVFYFRRIFGASRIASLIVNIPIDAIHSSTMLLSTTLLLAVAGYAQASEFLTLEGHTVLNDYTSPLPYTYISVDDLPDSFTWGDVDGKSYLTHSLNQHIPQYCGSCWAHGSVSALGDRIKIARKAQGIDINLAVQHILNCGGIG